MGHDENNYINSGYQNSDPVPSYNEIIGKYNSSIIEIIVNNE
jgi:hypothetical protein